MPQTLSRRKIVAGAAVAALLPRTALGALRCSGTDWYGTRQCEVGVPIGRFTARQRCDQWCWAACIEVLFRLHGYNVSQERIVERLYGESRPCSPAVGPGIIGVVNGRWESDDGILFRARAEPLLDMNFGLWRPDAIQIASRELALNNPLINGALGHATLMTAMQWSENIIGRSQLLGITVRDPWSTRQNRRQLSAQEIYGTRFLARVYVD